MYVAVSMTRKKVERTGKEMPLFVWFPTDPRPRRIRISRPASKYKYTPVYKDTDYSPTAVDARRNYIFSD